MIEPSKKCKKRKNSKSICLTVWCIIFKCLWMNNTSLNEKCEEMKGLCKLCVHMELRQQEIKVI